jgi:hypothetical protein
MSIVDDLIAHPGTYIGLDRDTQSLDAAAAKIVVTPLPGGAGVTERCFRRQRRARGSRLDETLQAGENEFGSGREVGILRVFSDELRHKPALRLDPSVGRAHVVERVLHELGAQALSSVSTFDLGVREHDDVAHDAVVRDPNKLVVDHEFIATALVVVAHIDAHACLRTRIVSHAITVPANMSAPHNCMA